MSLIKWPGGKSGEVGKIKIHMPEYDRYIEPFFGGGALFFDLKPEKAIINDVSSSLIDFYKLLQVQDKELRELFIGYNASFTNLMRVCAENYASILATYQDLEMGTEDFKTKLSILLSGLMPSIVAGFTPNLLLCEDILQGILTKTVLDKMSRTVVNHKKKPFNAADLRDNLITGFTGGYFMYFRKVFNDILKGRMTASTAYKTANFYFIREYCYGSMFRYNASGEFNIPYGGMSYNKKNFATKINNMYNAEIEEIFKGTEIHCLDFSDLFKLVKPTSSDFIFLDPPYDSEFSEYDGNSFTQSDHERLCLELKNTPAQFIQVIKNTDFIYNLYKDSFNVLSFDNQYTYNVRSRNERKVEHLLITNLR